MPDTIRLGLMPPLTGLVALYGPEITRAAHIACEEINERGGVLGRPLELIVEDDGSLPDTAVPAAKRLIDTHGCVAIIGNLLSNSRIAVAAQVAEPRHIPLLNFSFYEGSITGRYFFHFAALPNQQIERMIPFMARRCGSKMFFAGNNYEWPRGSIDAAKRALQAIDGDVVGEEYLPIGVNPQEIDRLLEQVERSGCDVFVPYFAGADQMILLTRFTEMGLKRRMTVVMGHYDEAMVSCLAPEVREGFFSSNTYFMSLDTPANHPVLTRLARQPGVTGIWPAGNGVLTNFGEGAYVCVHAFANAAETAGTTEAEALIEALEKVRVIAPQGLVEMDPETHHASVSTCLARCDADGSFAIVEHFGLIAPEIPARYRAQLRASHLHESPATPEVTARLAAELGRAQEKIGTAHQILSIADMAVIATDAHGIISEANRNACQIFGYAEGEMIGLAVHLLVPPHLRQRHAEMVKQFVAGAQSERRMNARQEIMGYRKDGSFFPLEASIAKFKNGELTEDWLLVVTLRDITEQKKAEEELTRRATHDPLTGLPNRALIRERLVNALQRSRRSGLAVVLLFVDLDGFKLINDTHGHEAGDALLKSVTARLIEQVRPGDTVARLAGDEFVVLCEQVEQPATMSVIAERINDTLRRPFEFATLPLFVTASIGIAIGTGSTHTADDLLRYADTAMYDVKQRGRDGWAFFNESLQEQARQRLAITSGLRGAIERNELSLRFQPIVAAESGRIVGAEALLRWKPDAGEISPATFIPIAEMTGSIVPIGAWVFHQGCLTEVAWRQRWGEAAPYLSVNLSTRQLSEENLAESFAKTLDETEADPKRLLLEITETSLMADVEANLRVLRRLANLGLRVAVDDFGTGYSSLAQLKRLPVDVLKIDRAFIDGIDKQGEARTIIRAVIGLGHALGLQLVAEGVESAAQQRELCAYRCDYIQGYYFHRPLEAHDFITTFEREPRDTTIASRSCLHFLIYVSRASQPLSADALKTLQAQALDGNRSAGISGCLAYHNGEFMQMLEGPRDSLFALFERIRVDPRHEDVKLVIEAPASRRVFHDWGMAVRDLTQLTDGTDFSPWQRRQIGFAELGEDALACYQMITAFATPLAP
ncbi:MAG: EAL domain-containing protein [Rhodocyclaceae bacterium]|nr:EAL domain-containing protein [Rhodocyclaceae bacterium]MDZ4213217.1 EAL domain-containing protein [Rhodocyclaceae bacterium]